MSVPYTPAFAATLLRNMPDDRLASITPAAFQVYWAPHRLAWEKGQALIDAERAARRTRT